MQSNQTNQLHKSISQDGIMSGQRMEIMDDTFECSRATQVHMEELRLDNLTEFRPRYAYE